MSVSDPECPGCLPGQTFDQETAENGRHPDAEWAADCQSAGTKRGPSGKVFLFRPSSNLPFEGSSKGIHANSLVDSVAQAAATVSEMLDTYRQPVLVEQFIDGDEVTVGMLGNSPVKVLGMMKIIPRNRANRFVYTVEVKRDWKNLVDYECSRASQRGDN